MCPATSVPGGNDEIAADMDVISPDYFLRDGVALGARPRFHRGGPPGAKGVIIINEILAERLWPATPWVSTS